jgi:hypothetical protein
MVYRTPETNSPGVHRIIGPTIMLGSGTYFDYESPETSEMTIEDYAYGLAGEHRFSSQTAQRSTGKRCFYTVAEHCVRMSYIVPKGFEYAALMHEGGEPTCGDMNGPLKSLCPEFKAIEKRCERASFARFGVEMSDPALIKHFDLVMLATEKRDLMPGADQHEWAWVQGVFPHPDVIVPWGSPQEAADHFLARWRELTGEWK